MYAKKRRVTATQSGYFKITKDGTTTYESGPLHMAKILGDQYQSDFTTPQHGPRKLQEMSKVHLTNILFTPNDVFIEISISSAPG